MDCLNGKSCSKLEVMEIQYLIPLFLFFLYFNKLLYLLHFKKIILIITYKYFIYEKKRSKLENEGNRVFLYFKK